MAGCHNSPWGAAFLCTIGGQFLKVEIALIALMMNDKAMIAVSASLLAQGPIWWRAEQGSDTKPDVAENFWVVVAFSKWGQLCIPLKLMSSAPTLYLCTASTIRIKDLFTPRSLYINGGTTLFCALIEIFVDTKKAAVCGFAPMHFGGHHVPALKGVVLSCPYDISAEFFRMFYMFEMMIYIVLIENAWAKKGVGTL